LIADVTPGSRTGRASLAVVCLSLLCLSGCRLTDVWSGVRAESNGSLQLAAKPPLCSCIVFQNRTDQPVFIEGSHEDATTGSVVVAARSQVGQRFDWAGPKPDDFYNLRAWTSDGSQLRFGTHVTFNIAPWEDCSRAACAFEPMMLNLGLSGHNPGDR